MPRTVSVYIPDDLDRTIEERRGIAKRSTFIVQMLREALCKTRKR